MVYQMRCFDINGNSIRHLTQWDSGQEIIIEGDFTIAPSVHFCNKNSKKAICVTSTIIDDGQIKTSVPNSLLTEAYPITIYVYLSEDRKKSTIASCSIPIKARPEPEDYLFEEDLHVVYLTELEQEVLNLKTSIIEATNNANDAANRALQYISDGTDIGDKVVTFSEDSTIEDIQSGDSLAILFQKIKTQLNSISADISAIKNSIK